MRIKSIECRNMWSFGEASISLDNLGQHNVVIGKNNVGKSKVLAALAWIKSDPSLIFNNIPFALAADVYHERSGTPSVPIRLSIELTLQAAEVREICVGAQAELAGQNYQALSKVVPQYIRAEATFELNSVPDDPSKVVGSCLFQGVENVDIESISNQHSERQTLSHAWHNHGKMICHKHTARVISNAIEYVSGWRTLSTVRQDKSSIIRDLHRWKSPTQDNKADRYRFDRVQNLFRKLILSDDFELIPEHNGDRLSLASGGRYLPIESFGDGVQHLLMVAYHLATTPDKLLLLEEPETHIHPQLQRNLMKVLKEESRGQTVITTHSPVLLDSTLIDKVFRVEHDGHCSSISQCDTPPDVYRVLDQLDVRASDLLQSNFVIWVEGPD